MKLDSLIVLIAIFIPSAACAFPTYMSVYRNKETGHSILLWGDAHESSSNEEEAEFLKVIRPYLNKLLSNKIPNCVVSIESNNQDIANIQREVNSGLKKPENWSFLERISTLSTTIPSPYLNSWLGLEKSHIPVLLGDNRTSAIYSLLFMSKTALPVAADVTINEILKALPESQLRKSIELQQPLHIVDKICFDQQFAKELDDKRIDVNLTRSFFIDHFKKYSLHLSDREYSIHDLVAQIRQYFLYCLQKGNDARCQAEQDIWSKTSGQIKWVDEAITSSFKPEAQAYRTPLSYCMIKKAIELKSFCALTPECQLTEEDRQQGNDNYNIYTALRILMHKYPNSSFLNQALKAADVNKNFVCIAGVAHCATMGKWLQSLNYSNVVECNYRKKAQLLNPQEIHTIFTHFAQSAQSYPVQTPNNS